MPIKHRAVMTQAGVVVRGPSFALASTHRSIIPVASSSDLERSRARSLSCGSGCLSTPPAGPVACRPSASTLARGTLIACTTWRRLWSAMGAASSACARRESARSALAPSPLGAGSTSWTGAPDGHADRATARSCTPRPASPHTAWVCVGTSVVGMGRGHVVDGQRPYGSMGRGHGGWWQARPDQAAASPLPVAAGCAARRRATPWGGGANDVRWLEAHKRQRGWG